jgi:hypothetical protein
VPLQNAVQNGYPVTENWMAVYCNRATTNLRLASVAATTDSDRNAFQLRRNEFDNMQRLSSKFLTAHKSMTHMAAIRSRAIL